MTDATKAPTPHGTPPDEATLKALLKRAEKVAAYFRSGKPLELIEEHEHWFPCIFFETAYNALYALRTYIEDESEPDISWENPWVEIRFPVAWNFERHAFTTGMEEKDWLNPDNAAFAERVGKGSVDLLYSHTLHELTHGAYYRKHGDQSVLHTLEGEALRAAEEALVQPVCWGGALINEQGDPNTDPALAARLESMLLPGGLTVTATQDDGTELKGVVVVQFHPLVVDEDEHRAYFPVVVGLGFLPSDTAREPEQEAPFLDPSTWSEEVRRTFWEKLLGELDKVIHSLAAQKPQTSETAQTGTTGTLPARPVPEERRASVASVMSPVPMPRAAVKDASSLALLRGLGRMFAGYTKVPDLDLRGETARKEAEGLFWAALEDTLNESIPGWKRETRDGKTVCTLPVDERKARSLWDAVTKSLNAEKDGPGIEVRAPQFQNRTHFLQGRDIVQETALMFWPEEALRDKWEEPVLPVRFRRESSPGYLALLERHGPRPFFADGWLWLPRGNEREGFRIGGLSTLLFPEGRAALERLKKRDLKNYETQLQRIFREPSLFRDADARAVQDLQAAVRRVKNWLRELSVYDIGPDLLLCVFEAFHRQRDAWVQERVTLPDGRGVETRPWRILRLDPGGLRVRLDPRGTWGKNWRGRLFEKLEALTTFQRQTRTRAGRKVDVGDRFLGRVIDGIQGIDEEAAPETDPGLGLVRALKRARAFPVDAFFVEVSVDFMERLVTWAVDEKGIVRWGIDAAKAAEHRALTSGETPKDARTVAREKRADARGKPYYEHSPRLLTLGNLEEWPPTRKLFSHVLLQERTPNFERYRDAQGTSRKRPKRNRRGGHYHLVTLDGRDFVTCHGAHGHGYRVKVWIGKGDYEKRTGPGGGKQAFKTFVEDLRGLVESVELRLELGTGTGGPLWDQEALRTLESYGRNPPGAYDLKLKLYLPADLEERLRERLEEAGIDAVDESEAGGASILTPSRPGGLTPAEVRMARLKAEWKQEDLAVKVGVSRVMVAYWENAKKPIPPDREARLREVLADYLEPLHPGPPRNP